MRAVIVVVARDPRRAKTRLRPLLGPRDRARLATAMFDDVLAAARATGHGVLVVTDARSVAARARAAGAQATLSPARGTRAAAAHGLARAARGGAGIAAVLAADLPLARAADLRRVLRGTARATIVPDRRGSGTNVLVLRPPQALAPRFGPRSLAAHRRAAGPDGEVRPIAALGLDVDTPADLRALARLARRAGPRTRAALAAMASGAAPSMRRGSPSPRAARSRPRRSPRR